MRTIPGMVVMNPADAVEARAAVEAAINHNGPVYIRFGRLPVSVINDNPEYKFEIGKGVKLCDGTDVTIVANGLMVEQALEAKEMLAAEGISASVINIHTIKPLDVELLVAEAKKTGAIVTTEEHNVLGGLGGAVAEALSEVYPVPVVKHGVPDKFGKSGAGKDLLEYFGLNAKGIVEKVKVALQLKK